MIINDQIIIRFVRCLCFFSGEHVLKIAVKGDGAVAELFRHLLRSFDNKHEIDQISTNRRKYYRPRLYDTILTLNCIKVLRPSV